MNPSLNRFYAFMAARVIDPNAAAPDLDLLTSRIMLPFLDAMPSAHAALAAAKEMFPVKLPVSPHPPLPFRHAPSPIPPTHVHLI